MDIAHHQACVIACQACQNLCLETASTYCLEQGWPHAERRHMASLLDCAAMCACNANFLLRGSLFCDQTCSICADICRHCADDCEHFNDARMDDCARVCRECADICLEMATSVSA